MPPLSELSVSRLQWAAEAAYWVAVRFGKEYPRAARQLHIFKPLCRYLHKMAIDQSADSSNWNDIIALWGIYNHLERYDRKFTYIRNPHGDQTKQKSIATHMAWMAQRSRKELSDPSLLRKIQSGPYHTYEVLSYSFAIASLTSAVKTLSDELQREFAPSFLGLEAIMYRFHPYDFRTIAEAEEYYIRLLRGFAFQIRVQTNEGMELADHTDADQFVFSANRLAPVTVRLDRTKLILIIKIEGESNKGYIKNLSYQI